MSDIMQIAITACFGAISWFLVDTLKQLRKTMESFHSNLSIVNTTVNDHESRVSVVESKLDDLRHV